MLLKKWTANILVETVGEIIVHVVKPLFEHIWLWRVLKTKQEEITEPLQRVLVHRIDCWKVKDTEIE